MGVVTHEHTHTHTPTHGACRAYFDAFVEDGAKCEVALAMFHLVLNLDQEPIKPAGKLPSGIEKRDGYTRHYRRTGEVLSAARATRKVSKPLVVGPPRTQKTRAL